MRKILEALENKCEYGEEWEKISWTERNNKLRSAGNDWR